MTDIIAFLSARTDWAETVALAAQESDPAPWSANVSTSASGTEKRSGHGAGLVIASDDTALWDCEGSSMLCMTVPTATHVAYHDPARALREVAAGRALLREIEAITIRQPDGALGEGFLDRPAGRLLRAMASAHSAHPDYNPAWKVEQ